MKHIYKSFKTIMLLAAMLVGWSYAAAIPTYELEWVGSGKISPGDETQIAVYFNPNGEEVTVYGIQLKIILPTGLSFKPSTDDNTTLSTSVWGNLGLTSRVNGNILGYSLTNIPNKVSERSEITKITVVASDTYSGIHEVTLSNCNCTMVSTGDIETTTSGTGCIIPGKVQVSKVAVTGVPETVRPTTVPFTLTALLTPENADYKTVIWQSSDESVAMVNKSTGEVTPIAEGDVTITAIVDQPDTEQGRGSATFTVLPVLPATIEIEAKGSKQLKDGETVQLMIKVLPENAKNKSVNWTSSDEEIATVDANGLVSAHSKLGTVQITATSVEAPTVKATVGLEVIETPVSKVIVTGNVSTVSIGNTITLKATVEPATATDKTVRWSSENSEIATVDKENGIVTGIAEGNAAIYATATNGTKSEPFPVTVIPVAVTEITLSPTESTLKVGETVILTATVAPENASNKNVAWSSSNESIATVDNGTVTAVGVGEADIIATAADGSEVKGSTKIIVVPTPVEKFAITGPASMQVGTTTKIEVTIEPSTATATMADITWESSDESMATVDKEGNVTAGGTPGEVTISATLVDVGGKQYTSKCTINIVGIAVTAISFETTEPVNLKDGESIELKVNIEPEDATDKSVTWTSDKEDIATVDENGKVTAKAKLGEVTITATANGGDNVKATIKVNVIATPVESINVMGDKSELKAGESLQLTYAVTPVTATDKTVVWSSSDTDVATVDENGTVQAISVGEVTITATANDGSGIKGTYEINVVPTPWSPETAFEPAEWELVVGESFTAALNILPEDATYKDYKISIEPEGVLSYEKGNGSVTFAALAEGKATVTATPVDGEGNEVEGQAVMTVTVNAIPEVIDNDGVSVTKIDLPLNSTITLYGNTDNIVEWKVIEGDGAEIASAEDNQVVLRGTKMNTTAKIQATFSNGEVVTITVNVTEPIDVYTESVTLTPSNKIVYLGDSFTPSVTLSPADHTGETLNWSSSDESVATVSSEGEIVAVGYGVATITLTVTNSNGTTVSASCVVIVSSATGIDGTSTAGFAVAVSGHEIIVTGLGDTDRAEVYNISGRLVAMGKGNCIIPVSTGLYVVKAGGKAVKVAVK